MRLLIIGGMHGNEPLGIEVVRLFQERPVAGVEVLLANEQAVAENCRFTSQDLNRSFPGDSKDSHYELQRAAQILKACQGYDVVLDFHNTYCPGNDCGFIGEAANINLISVLASLGLKRVIVADYDCINKYAPNCLSVEISMSGELNRADLWYERIAMLSRLKDVVTKADIEKYRFVYRMTLEDKRRLALDKEDLGAFQPLPARLARAMNVKSPAFPIFIADKFTPYNFGGLLNKIT